MYEYKAIVKRVYDADTIVINIDLGLGVWQHHQKIRLYGIDAPEIRGSERPEGLEARDYLSDRILYRQILIRTLRDKKGKYGRWLGKIYLVDEETGKETCLNDELVEKGFAVYRDY